MPPRVIQSLSEKGQARAVLAVLACTLFGLGAWQVGSGLYIVAKATVAQVLLDQAWADTLETGEVHKPWPWADTWPVAKLTVPRLGKSAIVLDKTSGQALAFGPGLMPGLAGIGDPGTALIAAHRDTHFAFLKEVGTGDLIQVETLDHGTMTFRVTGTEIVDTRARLTIAEPGKPHLVLSTCYPFNAISSATPYRYLVYAEKAEN